ncbi:hypothetical protein DN069_07755 [Streptacidiphilus pinicola]|uniref:Type I restriction modification DNA specificity domain-containing protein n=1 Tax=Streptacidiphilus pinicola TaxID=2219663 RepID=A0A2X0JEZ9_9ACTN|nr:restriction endonuclease subunit S [Streptacidiphilus pinicola]RAG86168.1 hypothetical protein DN069_07755 [Streptacidiphilus pinicola]
MSKNDEGQPLPGGWVRGHLRDVLLTIEAGKSFTCEPRPAEDDEWGVIKVSAMTWGTFRASENKAVPAGKAFNEKHEIRAGDILISRANTREYVGAPVLVRECRPRLLLSDKSLRLIPGAGVNRKWLLYILSSPQVREYISNTATGTKDSMRNISQVGLLDAPIDIPPLAEQQRIVEALEDYLSRLDAAEGSVSHAMGLLESLRMALPQGVIVHEVLPEGWTTAQIKDIAAVGTGSTPSRSRKDYYEDGVIPWVTSSLINESVITASEKFITELAASETSIRIFPAGSLLVAMYGEGRTRGKSSELAIPAAINQACAAIVLNEEHVNRKDWLKVALEVKYNDLRRMAAGGVQPNLNLRLIKDIEIPLPPIGVQEETLGEFENSMTASMRLGTSCAKAQSRARHLRRSILSRAFAGRLVPQDPSDEPASALLARVESERKALAKPTRRRAVKQPRTMTASQEFDA